MALIGLAVLYLAVAAAAAALAGWLGRPWGRNGDRSGWPPWAAVAVLTLLPLAFTVRGFQPGTTLAPTPLLAGVPPWAEAERRAAMEAEAAANPLLLDPLSQFLPWREAARRDLLFNPAQGGGAALLANGQSAVLYPTEVLARLLPGFRAATFSQAARLLVAAWGMFLLARALRRRPREEGEGGEEQLLAPLAAAAAWLGCGFLQVWRLHPHSLVAATVPWVLLALVGVVRRPGPRAAVGLAAAGTVAVAGGHPETLLHALLFGVLLAGVVAWTDERRQIGKGGKRALRVAGWGAAAALLAALLAAPLLLPFVDNLRVSSEWVLRRDSGTVVEVPLEQALERLRPAMAVFALGDPRDGTWTGPENLAELAGGSLGAAALLVALLALAAPDRRRRRLALALLVLGLLGLAVSVHLPGLSRPFGTVPLLRESLLKRLSLWWALAVPLLAALGVDAWRRGGLASATTVRFRVAALLAAVLVSLALAWAAGVPPFARLETTAWEWAPLAAALLLLLAVPPRARLAAPLLVGVLLLPRVALLAGWVPAVGPTGFYPETLATRFVAGELAAAGPLGYRVAGLEAALVPHSAAFFGLAEVRAYDPMTFAPYAEFLALAGEPSAAGWPRLLDPAHPALAFLGARFVFEHPRSGRREGVEVAYLDQGALVYENPRALPRAFLPPRVEAHATPEEALAAAAGIDDFAERVTVSGLDVGAPAGGRLLPSGPATLDALAVEPRRLRARVTAEAPALLATSQPAIPGWRLTLDGTAVPPLRVNGAFLGAVVPEGRHEVAMVYAPRSWSWGLVLFAAGLAAAAVLLVVARGRL